MDSAQAELHQKLLSRLLETYDANLIGVTLESATRAVLDFAAGALYFSHKETGNIGLLLESIDINNQYFTGVIRELVKNGEPQHETPIL